MQNTLDIVSLVKDYPLTRLSYGDNGPLVNKIKERFTNEDQQLFVANFYCYLNYDTRKDYVVELDKVWRWIGFSRLDHAKSLLVNNFIENEDYKIEKAALPIAVAGLNPSEEGKNLGNSELNNKHFNTGKLENLAPANSGASLNNECNQENYKLATANEGASLHGGHNKENIKLTIRCFKKLCLKAKTKKSDEIHEYYVNLEEVINELAVEQAEELKKQLQQITNGKIKDINDFNRKPIVYLIDMNEIVNGEKLYRIGNTHDIIERFRVHSNKLKDMKNDIIFKNGWDYPHIDIAVEVETLIKRYIKSEKIIYKYRDNSTEIFKTNNIYIIEKLIDKWSIECTEKYKKEKDNETEKIQLEKLKIIENLVNNGMSVEQITNLLNPKIQDLVQKVLPIKKEVIPKILSGIKCSRCGNSKEVEKYSINEATRQYFTNCDECRKKESDKLFEKNALIRQQKENEFIEKNEKINQVREKLLNEQINLHCKYCKKNKYPIDFGINKRNNTLYKICTECRENNEEENEENRFPECSKCKKEFLAEYNNLSKCNYKTCKNCREKDKLNDKFNKELINKELINITCTYCHNPFEKELNKKKDGFYKNCRECREKRKKYDHDKNILHKDKINEQKKEYYQKNKEEIREKQKEYYDNKSNEI